MNTILLGQGKVFHERTAGADNAFRYPTFFLYFDCSQESSLAATLRGRFHKMLGLVSVNYLDGNPGSIDQNIKSFLSQKCAYQAETVWLHTMPRMFGYVFNPVSFWFCYRDKKLEAVLVEVNNTFGERHFYWIRPQAEIQSQQWFTASKVFHVSPFMPVDGFYKFRFQLNAEKIRIDINYHAPDGSLRLATWVEGDLSPLAEKSLLGIFAKYGWITPMVMIRIHLQACILFFKKARFYRKPKLPLQEVTS